MGNSSKTKGAFLTRKDEWQVKMSQVQVHGLGKGILDNLEPGIALFLFALHELELFGQARLPGLSPEQFDLAKP